MKLRISITDKCNLSCFYCKPQLYKKNLQKEILSFEEIKEISWIFLNYFNLKCLKITGGEPFLRKDFIKLIKLLIPLKREGLERLSITTNGTFLKKYSKNLNGIDDINVSLDTLKEEKFKKLTGGNLKDVLEGLEEVKKCGVKIKLNCVLIKGLNDDEIKDLVLYSWKEGFFIRFIEYMPFGNKQAWDEKKVLKRDEILNILSDFGKFFEKREAHSVSKNYLKEDGRGFGIISPISEPFCFDCNRIRITSNGYLITCIRNGRKYFIKDIISSKNMEEKISFIKDILCKKEANIKENFKSPFEMVSLGG